MGLGGDRNGELFQNGGALIVNAGGEAIYTFIQTKVAWHVENETVLQVRKTIMYSMIAIYNYIIIQALNIDGPAPHVTIVAK